MAFFVPLQTAFETVQVNVDSIAYVRPVGEHTHIEFFGGGDGLTVTQTMDEVMNAINAHVRLRDDEQSRRQAPLSRQAAAATASPV